jgi:hypothetical protein
MCEGFRAPFHYLLHAILGGYVNGQSRLLHLLGDLSIHKMLRLLQIHRVQVLLVEFQEVLRRREDH